MLCASLGVHGEHTPLRIGADGDAIAAGDFHRAVLERASELLHTLRGRVGAVDADVGEPVRRSAHSLADVVAATDRDFARAPEHLIDTLRTHVDRARLLPAEELFVEREALLLTRRHQLVPGELA